VKADGEPDVRANQGEEHGEIRVPSSELKTVFVFNSELGTRSFT
jgi:hypothetical protein